MEPLQNLKEKVLHKGQGDGDGFLSLMQLIKEVGCVSDVIGRTFEVQDRDGKILYTVVQKPMNSIQLNTILYGLNELAKIEKQQTKKSMPKKPSRRGR